MRIMKISGLAVLRDALLPAIGPAIPAGLALYALQMLLAPSSLFGLAAIAAAGGLIYLLTYFVFPAAAPERQLARNALAATVVLLKLKAAD
jgi:hypothetical protein